MLVVTLLILLAWRVFLGKEETPTVEAPRPTAIASQMPPDNWRSEVGWNGESLRVWDGAETPDQPRAGDIWRYAKGFVEWAGLSLPCEVQWEYACRAGTTTVRYWADGEEGACRCANVADRRVKSRWSDLRTFDCDDGFVTAAPTGSFPPNKSGLYDLFGNVWEWCADAWVGSYVGAPVDGSQRKGDPGAPNVCRGGSWIDAPDLVRFVFRGFYFVSYRSLCLGFRASKPSDELL